MDKLRRFLLLVCTLVFAFACYKLISTLSEYAEGTNAYTDLSAHYTATSPKCDLSAQMEQMEAIGSAETVEIITETAPITVDFDSLLAECPDIVGWIYCPDTVINYPIAQADDNEKYLHTLPNGKWNAAGTIFLDCNNASDFSDRNSLLYGHNMNNRSMFAILPSYRAQEFYDAHPCWYLLTPEGDYKIELLAGFVTPADGKAYTIPQNDEDSASLVAFLQKNSDFIPASEPTHPDHLITLSTCAYDYQNARYVLVGTLQPLA